MASRPLANPVTYGTIVGNAPMNDLDTSFGAVFTSGFNDSALGWINYAADTGTLNNLACTLTAAPSTYTAGMCVAIVPANTNTSNATINVNSLGNKPIVNRANIALTGGELPVNVVVPLVYDGTSFRVIGPCPVTKNFGSTGANQTLNCAGATSVSAFASFTNVAGFSLTLQNLAAGVPVCVTLGNTSGSSSVFAVAATDPSATNYSHSYIVPAAGLGAVVDMESATVSITNGQTRIMTGISLVSGVLVFS
jgi:hypothetical protein